MKEGKFEPRSGFGEENISWSDEQRAARKFAQAAEILKDNNG
jgi:hypothetical protein